ncbi:MAG: discoidin domain-containing protein, partial [Planctomycetota bacterium]
MKTRRSTPLLVFIAVFGGCLLSGMTTTPALANDLDRSAAADDGKSTWALIEADWIDADRRFSTSGTTPSAALPAQTVTTAQDAAGGCDGVKTGLWGFHVASGEQDPWWQVDLGKPCRLDRVVIYNRCDSSESRTSRIEILVSGGQADGPPDQFTHVYQHDGTPFGGVVRKPLVVRFDDREVTARIVRLRIPGRCSFALDEVEVYAADDPDTNVALNKPADQISTSPYSHPGTMSDAQFTGRGYRPLVAREAATGAPADTSDGDFSLAHTRDVVDRSDKLAARLRPRADSRRLEPLAAMLGEVDRRLAKLESAGDVPEPVRRETYFEARRLVRQIAFTNPLFDFDKILFIKRHDSGGVFHMCDQYYGCNAIPGGGLFVLSDPFGPNPRLVNLLENAVVENGRLQGQKLEGGSFLSPELSFDGKTVLFAYTQAKAYPKYKGGTAYEWTPECSYHIFRSGADGSHLVQLTDGAWNDFDPCFLPNGRIAFISERRGGYLRCGRHCPVYTMFSMRPDGSDLANLSFHETHEWHPSVTNDGMIVYSRWDYVDRDTNIAHHIWTCYPDGRNPRSFHGNYPHKRETRPWMEMSIRAIPGSNKFVASTGAHHGNSFGSLVLIDHRVEDDGAASQLTRLTPDVPFPEAEGRPINQYMVYGTPWPLSEDDYLCVYDADAKNRGVYWIDRFGNKEVIYRDPKISC